MIVLFQFHSFKLVTSQKFHARLTFPIFKQLSDVRLNERNAHKEDYSAMGFFMCYSDRGLGALKGLFKRSYTF